VLAALGVSAVGGDKNDQAQGQAKKAKPNAKAVVNTNKSSDGTDVKSKPKLCYICDSPDHLRANCPNKPPKTSYIACSVQNNSNYEINRNLSLNLIQCKRKLMMIKLACSNRLFEVLPDSGAELSIINSNLAGKLKLHVFAPVGPKYIRLANQSLIRRKGFVKLPITVMFPGTERKPVVLCQQFELLSIEPQFIFGTDILPVLFQSDLFTQYMIPHASLTSKPTIIFCDENKNKMEVESKIGGKETPETQISEIHNKLGLEKLISHDHTSKSIESAIDKEMKILQNEMQDFSDRNSEMPLDEEISAKMIQSSKDDETHEAMCEFFNSQQISMTEPWKSIAEQNAQN
jgi:hypothetical protein